MYCTYIFYVYVLLNEMCVCVLRNCQKPTQGSMYVVDQLNLRYIGISAAYRKRILPDNRRRRRCSTKEEYEKVIYLPPIASYHMPI